MKIETSRAITAAQRLEAPASSLMRHRWIAASPRASVLDAAHLMRLARVRQLPVEEDGLLLGLLEHGELLRASIEEIRRPTAGGRFVAALMDPDPPSVLPGDTLQEVVARMLAAGLACIPVVVAPPPAAPRLVGIVVESDLLRHAYGFVASTAS